MVDRAAVERAGRQVRAGRFIAGTAAPDVGPAHWPFFQCPCNG